MNMSKSDPKQSAKPPKPHKNWLVDMTFNEEAFLPLDQTTPTTMTSTGDQPPKIQPTTPVTAPAATPAYNYKVELNCLMEEIETKLTKHFKSIFAQMEARLDTWTKQQDAYQEEQEKINVQVAKQLGFLVDNIKKFLRYATPPAHQSNPLLNGKGKS